MFVQLIYDQALILNRNTMEMAASVLFANTYFLQLDPKQKGIGLPYPPLGTLYAAAFLRQHSYAVSLFDSMFASCPDQVLEMLGLVKPRFFVLYDDGFNYLTKMCLTNMREAAFRMIALAREAGCRVIVSSSDATDRSADYLEAGAEIIIIGEGELTLLELVNSMTSHETDFSAIPGLAYLINGKMFRTLTRPLIRDLDSLPLPAWDLVDMSSYRASWISHAGYFSLNMNTTRGCPFKCNWCAKPIYGNRYHSRSPRKVIEEIKWLQQSFGVEHIWFCDDIFGLKPGWIAEFAQIMSNQGIKIPFKIQARADLMVRQRDVSGLATAGCQDVWMGAESGSQKILDAMDKGITVEQIAESTQLLKKHGIRPNFFIQFGYLGETWEDIRLTIDMINRLKPHEIGISVSYPLPGTLFYEKVKGDLENKQNWTDSDEMALMYQNTFSPAFYKQLHRYVHRNYKMQLVAGHVKQLLRQPFASKFADWKKAFSGFYYLPLVIAGKRKLERLKQIR